MVSSPRLGIRPWIAFALVSMIGGSAARAQDQTAKAGEEPATTVEETMVVTASRTEERLVDAPATMSVFTVEDIKSIPSDGMANLLRNVPGMNVIQTGARDIQMTGRGSTNTLATSQLVLLDNRTLYLDFFGFVMWDFLPVNQNEIKQVEAVRGPGSAVWGANAMSGVVNIITKRPQEMLGTSIMLGGGEIDTKYGSLTMAHGDDRFAYKVSAGYYETGPFERPQGIVPGTNPPRALLPYENKGTKQPKGDVRLSWGLGNGATFDVSGGYAGTDGIVQTGIGPFDVDQGSHLEYGKIDYNRQAFHIGFFANLLDADSVNLLTVDQTGKPLQFAFATDTYNGEISNTSVIGNHNILTYGANYRSSKFDLEITTPQKTDRDEYGGYLQDEILIGSAARWVIGYRYDKIDPLKDGVSTFRTSLNISPTQNHTFRLSYNEAFRTPSAINNYLDVTILTPVPLPGGPYYFPGHAFGDVGLEPEKLKAYEVSYLGTYSNGLIVNLAAYRNETKNSIDFFVKSIYGFGRVPPPQVGLPPTLQFCFTGLDPCGLILGPAQVQIPAEFSYRNVGKTTDRGVELSLQRRRAPWSWFINGSWQDKPEFEGLSAREEATQNLPPTWRGNAGFGYDPGRWFFNVSANYSDEAFWADVLNVTGTTDAYTLLNADVGFRFNQHTTFSVIGYNVTDERVQQHIFGDILQRKVTGQVVFNF